MGRGDAGGLGTGGSGTVVRRASDSGPHSSVVSSLSWLIAIARRQPSVEPSIAAAAASRGASGDGGEAASLARGVEMSGLAAVRTIRASAHLDLAAYFVPAPDCEAKDNTILSHYYTPAPELDCGSGVYVSSARAMTDDAKSGKGFGKETY